MHDPIQKLRSYLLELTQLEATSELLIWDQSVNMPSNHKGHGARAKLSAYIAGLEHRKATSDELRTLLENARVEMQQGLLNTREACIVDHAFKDFNRSCKLPSEFVEEQTMAESEAHQFWETAKARSDFKLFAPHLKKIVAMKRQEAQFLREGGQTLYDALLDDYEPNYGGARLEAIFKDLKQFLTPLIRKIVESSHWANPEILRVPIPLRQQFKFARSVVRKMGYDPASGGIHTSVHPFSTSFHPTDARITTRYRRRNFIYDCLLSLVHEAGHALYEQGLPEESFGTPLSEAVSCGIHESQARLWENMVGHSMCFWMYFYPKMQRAFPQFRNINLADFYGAINLVKPSFIRLDADEVTYNLHIILRFEIEKALIEGDIEVDDLPSVWNQKFQDYFGLKISRDSEGVLQDVHWSDGLFGYFPSYAIGNLYAAQFYEAAARDVPNLRSEISKGNFADLLEWLRSNIHAHGRLYSAEELLVRSTGSGFSPDAFIKYIKDKYSLLYDLHT